MKKGLLKVCISLALISFILSRLNWTEFLQNAKSIKIELFILAVSLAFVEIAIRALRWKLLLKVKGINISFSKSLSFMMVGMFFGIFLPTNFGGDIAKMYDFSKYSSRPVDTVSSVFMERWSGVISLVLLSVFVTFIFRSNVSSQIQSFVMLAFVILVLCSVIIFSHRIYEKTSGFFSPTHKLLVSLRSKLDRLILSIQEYKKYKTLFVNALLLAFLVNILRIAMNFVNSQAAGMNIPFMYFFIFIPITILIMMIPVSVSGIGVREGTYLYLFSQVGMTPSNAVLLSWMGFMLVICQALVGGIIFGLRKQSALNKV